MDIIAVLKPIITEIYATAENFFGNMTEFCEVEKRMEGAMRVSLAEYYRQLMELADEQISEKQRRYTGIILCKGMTEGR